MAKKDLLRRIDRRPRLTGPALQVAAGVSGSGVGTTSASISDASYVGRREGPHVGLFRLDNGSIFLQAVDTANVPFFSIGGVDYDTNATWLQLGYAGKYGIRMKAPTSERGDIEEHRDLLVDAECLTGTIPATVNWAAEYITDASYAPIADITGNLISEA